MTVDHQRFRLLVDAEEFWRVLKLDLAHARHRVWVETLSFEGDVAGKKLAKGLCQCEAPDRRMVVDEFTRWVQNDRFLYSPRALRDRELKAEVRETDRMMRSMVRSGVDIRCGSPLGLLGRRAAWRNHKKLIVIDQTISYLGGFNFTAHNFKWHDLMLRTEDPQVTEFLGWDFERVWKGERGSVVEVFDGIELMSIDPPDLTPYERVWSVISNARQEIFVESAYVTIPLSDALGKAAARGVRVRVISPEEPNRPFFRRYVTWEADKHHFELRFLPGMTHMKAILVDQETLVLGSSNLHFTGHRTQNEVMALVTDRSVIRDFVDRVVEPDWARSRPFGGSEARSGRASLLGMQLYMCVADRVGRGRVPPPREVIGMEDRWRRSKGRASEFWRRAKR